MGSTDELEGEGVLSDGPLEEGVSDELEGEEGISLTMKYLNKSGCFNLTN